jgi:phosphatidylserine/phosphatidylglycerophosphate/cardiolipin synthase-like enzyme
MHTKRDLEMRPVEAMHRHSGRKRRWEMKNYALATIALVLCLTSAASAARCDVEVLFTSPLVDQTIEQRIINEIDAAEEQILIAMYWFTDDELGAAVVRAHQRGVAVYVLMDEGQDSDAAGREWPKLVAEGILTAVEHQAGFLNHKFVVIDQTTVITGSYDWSDMADENNFENVVIIDCAAIAAQFVNEFVHIANDLLGLGWIGLVTAPTPEPGDPCLECLARLNESTESDFAECPGVDTFLAFRLEQYRPYSLHYCSQAAIETILLGVPGLDLDLVRAILECICEGIFD